MKSLIIYGVFLLQLSYAAVSHKNEQVWRVFASADNKREINSLVDGLNLDVWSSRKDSIDVLVAPDISSLMKSRLQDLGLDYNVMIEDIQKKIDIEAMQRDAKQNKQSPRATIQLDAYHELDEIYAYMDELAAEFDYITAEVIGQSVEGRDIKLLTLSTQPNNPNAIWVQCGIHAREWVSPATCLYGLDHFTSNYGQDPDVTTFLDSQDIYMAVVTNPDGYEYTWTDDRLWRKNRRVMENETCVGVDLNRNYDDGVSWGGSSTWPCSSTYQGEYGFSEPETAAIRDKVYSIQETQNVLAFFDVHSYSNLWLFAYGYTATPPPHFDLMDGAAAAAAAAVFPLYGTVIEHGSSYVVLYEGYGTSKDWGYAYGIIYSYTIELQDDGEYGFVLPEEFIIPAAIEAWTGIFAANGVM